MGKISYSLCPSLRRKLLEFLKLRRKEVEGNCPVWIFCLSHFSCSSWPTSQDLRPRKASCHLSLWLRWSLRRRSSSITPAWIVPGTRRWRTPATAPQPESGVTSTHCWMSAVPDTTLTSSLSSTILSSRLCLARESVFSWDKINIFVLIFPFFFQENDHLQVNHSSECCLIFLCSDRCIWILVKKGGRSWISYLSRKLTTTSSQARIQIQSLYKPHNYIDLALSFITDTEFDDLLIKGFH